MVLILWHLLQTFYFYRELLFDEKLLLDKKICTMSAVGRKKAVECGLMSELVHLLADDGTGAELQETVLDLLASLCEAGKLTL